MIAVESVILDAGYDGYFDRKALVVTPGGLVAEIQIWEKNLLDAKG